MQTYDLFFFFFMRYKNVERVCILLPGLKYMFAQLENPLIVIVWISVYEVRDGFRVCMYGEMEKSN